MSSAPGKVMLAGEYAVLEGHAAVMMAIDRRAHARVDAELQELSPLLAAARDVLAERGLADAAERLAHMVVDSSELTSTNGIKLGLGSSAAAVVAAIGESLAEAQDERSGAIAVRPERDRAQARAQSKAALHALAHEAHARAQAARGAAGSGADVAVSVYGGVVRVTPRAGGVPAVEPIALPGVELVFVWTGEAADTVPLVARVVTTPPAERAAHLAAIAAAADQLATDPVAAVRAGGAAVRALGELAGVPLWIPAHTQLSALAEALGGALKPTGAGGGDVALAAFAEPEAASRFRTAVRGTGMKLLELSVSHEGLVSGPSAH